MLRSLKSIFGYSIQATDEEVGKVTGSYFDDEKWIIRYLVVDTAAWLMGRRVLLSPFAFVPPNGKPDWTSQTVPVFLTKSQVEKAPSVSSDLPISRQKESDMAEYYGWPYYWVNDPFTVSQTPNYMPPPALTIKEQEVGDSHLRSSKEVIGYGIHGTDGDIGHVEDFIIDDESWQIKYVIVDTKNILPGKKVMLSLQWIKGISWAYSKVDVNLSCEEIKNAPEYRPDAPVNRETEEVLYDYYGKPKYWVDTFSKVKGE